MVSYTLNAADGTTEHPEVHATQVPRVGEMVAFGGYRSYQVVDVLWHISDGDQPSLTMVTVTACERDWHEHIRNVVVRWEKSQRTTLADS